MCYKSFSKAVHGGYFQPDTFEDQASASRIASSGIYDDKADWLNDVSGWNLQQDIKQICSLDERQDQEHQVILVFEAAAMWRQFEYYAEGYPVDLWSLGGQASNPHKYGLAQRINELSKSYPDSIITIIHLFQDSVTDDLNGAFGEVAFGTMLPGPIYLYRRPANSSKHVFYWELMAWEQDNVSKIDFDPGFGVRATDWCPEEKEDGEEAKPRLFLRNVDKEPLEHVLMRNYASAAKVGTYGSTRGIDVTSQKFKDLAKESFRHHQPEIAIPWDLLTPWCYEQRSDTTRALESALETWVSDRIKYNVGRKCLEPKHVDHFEACIQKVNPASPVKFSHQLWCALIDPPWAPLASIPTYGLEQLKRRVQNRENVR